MRYEQLPDGATFVLAELSPAEEQAARELAYQGQDGEFRKIFRQPDTAELERIFRNFSSAAARMIRQTTREEPAPWEEALRLFHPRVKDLGVNWWLGGSAALALRGAHVSPRDIDVITDATGALAIDGALHDALIEPLTASDGWIAGCFGRAFLEMRIEWVGDVVAEIDSPHVTDFGPTAARSLEIVEWEDMEFRLPPLYLQLYSATRRKLDDRVAVIAELVRS